MTETIDLIRDYTNVYATSGFEQDIVKAFAKETAELGQLDVDGMFNAILRRKENNGKRPVVQLDAHSDSVGLLTQAIRPNGLIKFVTLGGWVPANLTAMKVVVRNRAGKYIPGVVATKPPHFMTAEERKGVPAVADMSVDVGSSSREETLKDFQIDTGCPIFPDVQFQYNADKGLMFGKDFDDRLGAAAMTAVMQQLAGEQLNVDVAAGLSAQEEVGLRGAYVTARKIEPDISIVLEGCPADDTFEPDWLSQTKMGGGPMLRDYDTTFVANPVFENYAAQVADELGIPYTRAVRTGGGQDGAAIAYWKGVPTIVIGIPTRYEHSAYNWAKLSDVENAIKLTLALLRRLDKDTLASFTQF